MANKPRTIVKEEYRRVSKVGKAYNPTARKVHKSSKTKGYSLSVIIPVVLAKQLSITNGSIVKFTLSENKLILEKVELSE